MDNDYGQATMDGFLEAAGKYGIEVLNKYSYSLKDRQFGSIVASVKRDNPDAVYATGYFFTGGPLVSQLRAAGITVPIIGSQAFDSEKFIEIAGPAAEGTYIIDSFDRDRKDETLQKFFAEFKTRAGYSPEGVAADHLFGGEADGRRHQARQQRRSGQGARRARRHQGLPDAGRQSERLQQPARDHHADQRQRDQGRQVQVGRRDHRSHRVRASREIMRMRVAAAVTASAPGGKG